LHRSKSGASDGRNYPVQQASGACVLCRSDRRMGIHEILMHNTKSVQAHNGALMINTFLSLDYSIITLFYPIVTLLMHYFTKI
jgi:hypothetical protein